MRLNTNLTRASKNESLQQAPGLNMGESADVPIPDKLVLYLKIGLSLTISFLVPLSLALFGNLSRFLTNIYLSMNPIVNRKNVQSCHPPGSHSCVFASRIV